MKSRRLFVKNSLIVGAGLLVGKTVEAKKGSVYPYTGVVYTKNNPGKWAGKVNDHLPRVSVKGRGVRIETPHVMNKSHYIVRHTLVSKNGEVIGEKTFYPGDKKAVSTFKLSFFSDAVFFATSFCNKHDLWVTRFNV